MRCVYILGLSVVLFSLGCDRKQATEDRAAGDAHAAILRQFLPKGAIDVRADRFNGPKNSKVTLLGFDWPLREQPELAATRLQRLLAEAGWKPIVYDLAYPEMRSEWKELPPDETPKSQGRRLTQWWIDEGQNAISIDILHWQTRTDGGPEFRVTLRYLPRSSIEKNLRLYRERHGSLDSV